MAPINWVIKRPPERHHHTERKRELRKRVKRKKSSASLFLLMPLQNAFLARIKARFAKQRSSSTRNEDKFGLTFRNDFVISSTMSVLSYKLLCQSWQWIRQSLTDSENSLWKDCSEMPFAMAAIRNNTYSRHTSEGRRNAMAAADNGHVFVIQYRDEQRKQGGLVRIVSTISKWGLWAVTRSTWPSYRIMNKEDTRLARKAHPAKLELLVWKNIRVQNLFKNYVWELPYLCLLAYLFSLFHIYTPVVMTKTNCYQKSRLGWPNFFKFQNSEILCIHGIPELF